MTTQVQLSTEFLRIKEAARTINMSTAFMRKEARAGRGPQRVRCGKIILYPVEGLRQYMAERVERPV
jgi:hypothetical protein